MGSILGSRGANGCLSSTKPGGERGPKLALKKPAVSMGTCVLNIAEQGVSVQEHCLELLTLTNFVSRSLSQTQATFGAKPARFLQGSHKI